MAWTNIIPRKTLLYTLPLIALTIFFIHANYYMPFIADDTLISLRYAARLLHGQGLTWTDGRPVEGYSNLMWVLLIALMGFFGIDLVDASRILGVMCMAAVIGSVSIWYLSARRQAGSIVGLSIALLFFAGSASVAIWSIGGLEQPLIATGIAIAIPLYWRATDSHFSQRSVAFGLSFILGLLCLTRPDSPLFVVGFIIATLLHHPHCIDRQRWMFLAVLVSLPALCYGGQTIFRLAYYGEWVPNTALVKLVPSWVHVRDGIRYVYDMFILLAPMSLLALVAMVAGVILPASRKRFIPLLILTSLWLSYLVVIGGDIFPACRHGIPIIVIFVYALAEGTLLAWKYLGNQRLRHTWFVVAMIGAIVLMMILQPLHYSIRWADGETWEWDCRALALTLKGAFEHKQPLLAVTAAGCLPYWSEFPSLDMLGLNDYYLPRHKPEDIGNSELGHALGDGDYVLQQAPDILVFSIGDKLVMRTGEQLAKNQEFHQRYRGMYLNTAIPPYYTPLVWFNTTSSRIGYIHDDGKLIIPAYFMNAFETTAASLDGDHFVVEIDRDHPAGIILDQLLVASQVAVRSPYAEQIQIAVEQVENSTHIVLTTGSKTALPVEALVITEPSGT